MIFEIFMETLENFKAMKTGNGIESFHLATVCEACWTGTEYCNLTQENHNEAKQCNHGDTSHQNRDKKWIQILFR